MAYQLHLSKKHMTKMIDEELEKRDVFELITTFINLSVNKADISDRRPTAGKPTSANELSFVITRHRTSSWAEDLAQFISIEERNRPCN